MLPQEGDLPGLQAGADNDAVALFHESGLPAVLD